MAEHRKAFPERILVPPKQIARAAVRSSMVHSGRHSIGNTTTEPIDVAHWGEMKSLATETKQQRRVAVHLLENGLQQLVTHGDYSPEVTARLATVKMTPIHEGSPHDPTLKELRAYVDLQGRYILTKEMTPRVLVHELMHRVFPLQPASIFSEAFVEQGALDVLAMQRMMPDQKAYGPHRQVLQSVEHISGLSHQDATALVSGNNSISNYQHFREHAQQGAGWDIVGYVDRQFITHYQAFQRSGRSPLESNYFSAYAVADEIAQYDTSAKH